MECLRGEESPVVGEVTEVGGIDKVDKSLDGFAGMNTLVDSTQN